MKLLSFIKSKYKIIIVTILIIATLFIIFGNSARPASDSNEVSMGLTEFLAKYLKPILGKYAPSNHFIRKAAHFCEFAVLGAECTVFAFFLWGMKPLIVIFPSIFALICAGIDETIQKFFPGRGPSIRDVGLDFCGVMLGVAVTFLIIFFVKRRKN